VAATAEAPSVALLMLLGKTRMKAYNWSEALVCFQDALIFMVVSTLSNRTKHYNMYAVRGKDSRTLC